MHAAGRSCLRASDGPRTAVPGRLAHHLLVQMHLRHPLIVAGYCQGIHLLWQNIGRHLTWLPFGMLASAMFRGVAGCSSNVHPPRTCTQTHSLAVSSSWKIERLRFNHIGAT